MARPGLQKHPKFRRLVKILNVPVPHAVGYLECLWEVAYECGDPLLGEIVDVELAAQWPGEPGKLCQALLTCGGEWRVGFVEQRDDGKYQVHDLWDHAPDYVQQRNAREEERKIEKICAVCGGAYRSKDPRSQVCSGACRSAAYRRRKAAAEDGLFVTDRDGPSQTVTERHTTPARARALAHPLNRGRRP